MKRVAIITASDSGYRGEREDLSGPAAREIVEKAGYEVFVKPKDIYIPAENPLVARIAFCYGPLGEQIELFYEK